MVSPHYDLKSFKDLCGTTSKHKEISLGADVLDDAKFFNLSSKSDILYCIDETDLKAFQLDNSCLYKQVSNLKIIVDSYLFKIDHKDCYLAFFYDPRNGQWLIKSFHLPAKGCVVGNNAFQKALQGKKVTE